MSIDRRSRSLFVTAIVLSLAACSTSVPSGPTSDSPTPTTAASLAASLIAPTPAGSRPSSPAVVAIVSPKPNEVVTGSSAHIVITLQNAQIVPVTSTNVRPDQGHIHLYVDNVLVSMNYGLAQDLPVQRGTYLLKAEFVAADHAPFDPRVWSTEVLFTVQ
jgi:hypothetical protein